MSGSAAFQSMGKSIPSDFEQTSLRAVVSDWCYSTFGFSYTDTLLGLSLAKRIVSSVPKCQA